MINHWHFRVCTGFQWFCQRHLSRDTTNCRLKGWRVQDGLNDFLEYFPSLRPVHSFQDWKFRMTNFFLFHWRGKKTNQTTLLNVFKATWSIEQCPERLTTIINLKLAYPSQKLSYHLLPNNKQGFLLKICRLMKDKWKWLLFKSWVSLQHCN